jgi:hypothetical protein
LRAKQSESLEIEHLAELAASLSASAIEVLKKNRKKKSRPVDTKGCAALVAYLQGVELKYTGRNSRYTFNAYTEKFGGTFFLC